MADIAATDVLHDMKQTQKHGGQHHEHSPNTNGSEDSQRDMEKTASHGAGYDLSHIPMDDGEYRVTAKTWAVVVVLSLSYGMDHTLMFTTLVSCMSLYNGNTGISFWPVPFFSTIQSSMAEQFGANPAQGAW